MTREEQLEWARSVVEASRATFDAVDEATDAVPAREGLVPVASDGTTFNPDCAYADGSFKVGPKGSEVAVTTYAEGLALLRSMPTAYWRRPSAGSGRHGIVRAVGWIALQADSDEASWSRGQGEARA